MSNLSINPFKISLTWCFIFYDFYGRGNHQIYVVLGDCVKGVMGIKTVSFHMCN